MSPPPKIFAWSYLRRADLLTELRKESWITLTDYEADALAFTVVEHGCEAAIISSEISQNQSTRKFVPIIRQQGGRILPTCMGSRGGFDLSEVNKDQRESRSSLVSWLKNRLDEEEGQRAAVAAQTENARDLDSTVIAKRKEALAATEPYKVENFVSTDKVRFSRSRILLDCFLPDDEAYGSLLININTLYLHRVQITLDARQILGSLLRGWGTPLELKQRGFIIGPLADQPNEWIVRIAGATVFLTIDELRQLCEVVDLLAPRFLKALLDREVADGTLAFAPDGPKNVRLLSIKRPLWAS